MRSLQKSSPTSDCMPGVHGGLLERGESSNVLDLCLHLGSGSMSKEVDRSPLLPVEGSEEVTVWQ